MPSRSTTPPLLRAVLAGLAGLWLASCRGDISDARWPGCDNGKLHLQRDLPGDVYLGCPLSAWQQSAWKHPATNRLYDPEPARQICMDRSIVYKDTIPNSGAYRPVMAESGEYVYCPPQRWLNNLNHAATVLLHHPCIASHERVFLSVLARSCLTHYILTSHPPLARHTPVALVSWGRTLELSTVVSPGLVCDWLENTTSTRKTPVAAGGSGKYNRLLTWSAEQHRKQRGDGSNAKTEMVRQCCEKIISSFLLEKEEDLHSNVPGKRRKIRAAFADRRSNANSGSVAENDEQATADVPALNTTTTTNVLSSNISYAADAGGRVEQLQPGGELNRTSKPSASPLSKASYARRSDQGHVQEQHTREGARPGTVENADENDKEGDLDRQQTQNEGEAHHRNENVGSEPVEPSETELAFQAQAAGPLLGKKGFPRSPRTDEAAWAAAALGSLLVLLALAVLHTRLYRHWRTTPSLYWYDPQRDYESVADVIRRRLRIAQRRSKRSRRQQCVLLPVSSSSDEN